MNGITATRFGDTSDPVLMAKQLAEAVNKIEWLLQKVPLFFGVDDPNGEITAQAGSLYIRQGAQGLNAEVATPHIYIKTNDGGVKGWLSLLFLGSQAQTSVSAFRGSLYIKVPPRLIDSAAIYFKTADDAATTGWAAL